MIRVKVFTVVPECIPIIHLIYIIITRCFLKMGDFWSDIRLPLIMLVAVSAMTIPTIITTKKSE
ncbi:MAG: hypothetical protein LBG99_03500 [Propionibacteriaceae bacterium]|jgi:hypothetical protein|nr:hypothetical protein [Propionibacteriaceae bacterium]